MKNILWITIVFIGLVSCQKRELTPQEMIVGDWSIYDTITKPWLRDKTGYEFFSDGTCDYKPGYLDWYGYLRESRSDINNKVIGSFGNVTKYKLLKDSLKIFNLTEKSWNSYGILKFKNDTLLLKQDTVTSVFIKKHYDISQVPDFDAIIVSSSSCFGPCPAGNLIIHNNGNVIYKGVSNVSHKGWQTGTITASEFNIVRKRFKKADYMNLKNDYRVAASDGQTVSLSFVKNGRIIKTIDDFSESGPNELIWAYIPLLTLEQNLKLKSKDIRNFPDHKYSYSECFISDSSKELLLSSSEIFYLSSLLMDAQDVNITFAEKYKLSYQNDFIKEITTDGRYYKLYYKDGKTEVKDLGYNFITENKLKNKLETIKN